MTLPLLSSPDAVVLGTNTMDATAAFLEGLGFTETGRTVLTEEAAESLYGVTMQEQGVSKLVSVRLQAPPPPPPPNLQSVAVV